MERLTYLEALRGMGRDLLDHWRLALLGAVAGSGAAILLSEAIRWCQGYGFFR